MSEDIYILEENGTIKGLCDRKQAHSEGILHLTIQCWIINSKNEVLLQKRSLAKDQCPGQWDVSFGGHCTKTDDKNVMLANLVREAEEELGLQISADKVVKLGEIRYTFQEGKNKELMGVFLFQVPDDQKFTFKDGEVSEIKWVNIEELKQNVLFHPEEYANKLPALFLLDFYK